VFQRISNIFIQNITCREGVSLAAFGENDSGLRSGRAPSKHTCPAYEGHVSIHALDLEVLRAFERGEAERGAECRMTALTISVMTISVRRAECRMTA
jgi:hypothetical protein